MARWPLGGEEQLTIVEEPSVCDATLSPKLPENRMGDCSTLDLQSVSTSTSMDACSNTDWWASEESIPDWPCLGKNAKEDDMAKATFVRPTVPLLRLAQLQEVVQHRGTPGSNLPCTPLCTDSSDAGMEDIAGVNSFSPEEADRRERELKHMVTELQQGLHEGKQSVEACLKECALDTPEETPRSDERDDGQYKIFTPRPRIDSREAEISAKAALAWDFEESLLDSRPFGLVPAELRGSAHETPFRLEDVAKPTEDLRRSGGVCPISVGQSLGNLDTQVETESCFRRAGNNRFGKTGEKLFPIGSVRFNIYTPREPEIWDGRKCGEPELTPCDELDLSQHSISTPRLEDICLSARSTGSEAAKSALVCDFEDALVELRGTCKRTPRVKAGEFRLTPRSVGCLTSRDRRPAFVSRPDEALETVGARTIATQTDDNTAAEFNEVLKGLQDARIPRSETRPTPRLGPQTSTPRGRVGSAEYSCPRVSAVCAHVVPALPANEEVSGTQFWVELKGAVRQDLSNLGEWMAIVAKERVDEKTRTGRWLRLFG
jgi:hypothetical protein